MHGAVTVLVCFLMVSGTGYLLTANGPSEDVRAKDGAFPALSPVPAAPGSENDHSDPFTGLNRSKHPAAAASPAAALTGTDKVVVLLINYNDVTNTSTHTPKFFDDMLFNGSSPTSMNKFFKDNSYGVFCVTGNVTTKWYAASNSQAYYGTYEFWSPRKAGYGNAQDLVKEAVQAADADINFSNFDQDSDGYVDHLVVVHAGYDDANDGDGTGPDGDPHMWSHAWGISPVLVDGVYAYTYTMLSEYSPVGTFAHEYGHDIGLPDLYDTDYSSSGGVGKWDIMASGSWNNGGNTPAQLSAWCKQELGWITPTLITADTETVTAKRVEDNSTTAVYKIWVNFSNNEYFLVENRQQVGWDAYLPGNGLLIWHINDNAPDNSDGARDKWRIVDLEEYDNNDQASNANDPWKSNSVGFTPSTSPNSNDYSGKSTGIRIFNISASGNTMTFDVGLANVAPNAPAPSAPADAVWTNLSKPVLNWTFSDQNLGDSQTAYRVQVDDDSAFGTPNWDSGDTVGVSATCTVGSALTDGKWYWRVRTRDSGGLWGPYNSATVRSVNIDLTPPAAPVSPKATPANWTAANSFSIDWTMPSESGTSGIATGAYYKLDSAPASATDGTWVPAKPMASITVSGAGNHTIYLWLKDNVGNINQSLRSATYLYFDNVAPNNPGSLGSTTHTVSTWSNASSIMVQWSGASDAHSGVAGYSYLWDGSPTTLPDSIMDCTDAVAGNTSVPLTDGTYYFHIRTVDNVSNWAAGAVHLGPFWIDLTPPGGVLSAASTSHLINIWSNLSSIAVQWWGAADGGSGVGAFSYLWDREPDTLPDTLDELDASRNSTSSPSMADTNGYYFHVRVRDACGNWNSTAFHLGPFAIDTTPPANPGSYSVLTGQKVGRWSADRDIEVMLAGHGDALSGVAGFSIVWDVYAGTTADSTMDLIGISNARNAHIAGNRNYLHVRTVDAAGNWNETTIHIGPFLMDTDNPSQTGAVADVTLTNISRISWSWPAATDPNSGVGFYLVWIVKDPGQPDLGILSSTTATSFTMYGAQDGKTYYLRVKAVDNAGNAGEWGSFSGGVLVDLSGPNGLSVIINNGSVITGSPKLSLAISAVDGASGVADMRFGQDGLSWGDWLPFEQQAQLALTAGDGLRPVYFQARDRAGNEARPVKASIILDTTGPRITLLEASSGPAPVNFLTIHVWIEASDLLSAPTQVRLSSDGKTWGAWLPYGQLAAWDLSQPDGSKEVLAQARDAIGNIGPASKMVVALDTKAPGKLAVTSTTHPGSTIWSNSPIIELRWTAPADESGIAGYSYLVSSGAGELPAERIVTTSTGLTMPVPGEGRWHFRVMAQDGAGNWGDAADLIFQVDTVGPEPPALNVPANGAEFLPGAVQLGWGNANDAQSGVKGYYVQVDDDRDFSSPVFDGVVDGNGYTVPAQQEGNYYWHVKARDGAGNWGQYSATSVFLLRNPIPPTPQTPRSMLDLSNPLLLLMLGLLLVGIIAGVAGAARRKKKRPPVEAYAAEATQPVNWE